MQDAHSSRPGHDETTGDAYAGHPVSAARPGDSRALSSVDFHYIPPAQEAIHERLLNWAKWVHGSDRPASSPMFASYRSTEVWAAPDVSQPVDTLDAQKIERAVCGLGLTECCAIRWHYVKPVAPHRVARDLGLTKAGLAQAVIDARETLSDRLTGRVNPVSSPERMSQWHKVRPSM